MRKTILSLIVIALLQMLLFAGLFHLFQNETIYRNTLGKFSQNYIREGGWNNYQIYAVSKPYVAFNNENLKTWDIAIYQCICQDLYTPNVECYGWEKAAFFPLFPLLWKASHSSAIGMVFINYFLFTLSLALLLLYLLKTSFQNQLITYGLSLVLPSAIIFYIPYSESLFLFTMTIATIGLLRNKYLLYFTGILLMAMVKPATVFVLLAMVVLEFLFLSHHKDFSRFAKQLFLKSSPFGLGYIAVLLIQKYSSGSWKAFAYSRQYWNSDLQNFNQISDWSVEGFGLSTFALFVVCIPALLYGVSIVLSFWSYTTQNLLAKAQNYKEDYLLLLSVFYLSGILLFIAITSGGSLHSFFRFTLASPLFYIALFILLSRYKPSYTLKIIWVFLSSIIGLVIFLYFVEYGGNRDSFSFFGLYLYLVISLFWLVQNYLNKYIKIISTVTLIILSTIWNTYLLNMLLSNAWIFT